MKIAHLIIAHKNPIQLERLVKRLNHIKFDIYIHLDKRVSIDDYDYLANVERVYFIKNRILCTWGGFSLVKAISESVVEILKNEQRYEYINLISAQDYPLKSMDIFYRYLKNNTGQSFMSYEKFNESAWWKHAVSRYELYHFTDIKIKGKYVVQRILNVCLPKRKFPLPYDLYGGSCASWWTLHRDCIEYIIGFLNGNPSLISFMKFTWGADEFLFPTIIMNSPFRDKVQNTNLRHIEWLEGKVNPEIFEISDFDKLKNSDSFFARKFDVEVDTKVLDLLDNNIN